MLEGLLAAVAPTNLLVEILGVLVGIVFGAIPGMTATLAIALVRADHLLMSPDAGMIMLGGIYAGAIFGGQHLGHPHQTSRVRRPRSSPAGRATRWLARAGRRWP